MSPSSDLTTNTHATEIPRTLDTPRAFPTIRTLAEWEKHREAIRTQILVSCGLYPLPPKTPLDPRCFDRVERDGYTIEKVYFQTYPGFYLAGNLYRPFSAPNVEGKGKSRIPGVLIAHGHWLDGRMADEPDGSIAARAITFARQGYIAFSYDMVGFQDTRQLDHTFGNDRLHWLWGVSLMGLQTWNSIRALDFLASLPDTDLKRLAITGESGGGTQTMMLGAIDDRLAAVGPCVMVSHSMQGGCLCENAPGLRIEFSNMEIAAAAAPRPQIMVGATGDWTRKMMSVEGPAVESIYRLYAKPQNLKYVIFDYNHNINKTSREAVYTFFGEHMLKEIEPDRLLEPPYHKEPTSELRVFPDGLPLPSDARNDKELTSYLISLGQSELDKHKPDSLSSLQKFKKLYLPAWEHTLALDRHQHNFDRSHITKAATNPEFSVSALELDRGSRKGRIPAQLLTPATPTRKGVLIVDPSGKRALVDSTSGDPGPQTLALLHLGYSVLLIDAFLTGDNSNMDEEALREPFENYFTTYNRTDLQERVQDIVTSSSYLRKIQRLDSITLIGRHKAGLWTLLAAPAADAVVADCAQLDLISDNDLLSDDLFVPCLRRLGDFRTAATLAAPYPLLLHNTGAHFSPTSWIEDVYRSCSMSDRLRIESAPLTEENVVNWVIANSNSAGIEAN